jgi:hypothetical protein
MFVHLAVLPLFQQPHFLLWSGNREVGVLGVCWRSACHPHHVGQEWVRGEGGGGGSLWEIFTLIGCQPETLLLCYDHLPCVTIQFTTKNEKENK